MKNILGYYLMPHPPIILSEIGRGEEKKISKTSEACNKIGREIAGIRPDTIIIITPHAAMFSDAIAISKGDSIKGDMSRFGCNEVSMEALLDSELSIALNRECEQNDIPSALVDDKFLSKYNHGFSLDHGAMIPLSFVNKYYKSYKLVHITYSPIGGIELYRFGMEISKVCSNLNRKAVIIASGDLSHKLKEEGPYSYSPYGECFDREFLANLVRGDVSSVFAMNEHMIEEAAECGLKSMYILLGTLDGSNFKGEILSYEGPFGVGYGVVKFVVEDNSESKLKNLINERDEKFRSKREAANPYTKLARKSLSYYFANGTELKDLADVPTELLNKKHGVFVSLKKFGALRGCIGTISPITNSVAEEIIRNAIEAAINDPRFPAVNEDELQYIDVSVDELMEAEKVKIDELNPKKYGVIVTSGYRRGLLLPDLEGVDTIEEQIRIALGKAGIKIDEEYTIERFEVVRHKEGEE